MLERKVSEQIAYLATVPLAGIESRSVVARHVPLATHDIINMLTKSGCVRAWLACTETKLVCSDEVLRSDKEGGPGVRI